MRIASFEIREWIDPWRDRRPMTDDLVLVTYWFNGKRYVGTASYTKGSKDQTLGSLFEPEGWNCCGTVLAWQPLPDTYNPVEEEDAEAYLTGFGVDVDE